MAAFTVGATDIAVARDGVEHEYRDDADLAEMLDMTMRRVFTARKSTWRVRTRLLTAAEKTTQLSALTAAQPITISGDIPGGSVSCLIEIHECTPVPTVAGYRYRIRFSAHERS
jgi:hypothetical protein